MGVMQLVCGPNHEQNKKDNNTTENILAPECRSLYVSGRLPTYPSPKPILTHTSDLGQNVGLGEE